MRMKKLLVLSMVVAMVGAASAAKNFIINGSFEAHFSSTNSAGVTNGVYNGVPGSFAFGAVLTNGAPPIQAAHVPGWDGEVDNGYVWNPSGTGGTNHWGTYVGLTNLSHGSGAYGAWGDGLHYFRTWQLTNIRAEEGDTVIFSWDINFLSADYSGGWFNGTLQFIDLDPGLFPLEYQINAEFPHNLHGEPLDVWLTHSITQVVTAAQAGSRIQVQLNGAGAWVDNVRLEVDRLNHPADELLYNESFELPFTDGYAQVYDPAVPNSKAYMSFVNGNYIPAWSVTPGEDWGYVWNPTGSGGTNHWNDYVGLTTVSDGNGAAGSWGFSAHVLNTWQNTQEIVLGGDTVIFSWDMNFLSADYGVNAWLVATLQFVGNYAETKVNYNHGGFPDPLPLPAQDVWLTHSVTQVVEAAQSGSTVQVHFQASGTWIDNVSLKVIRTGNYEGWIASYGVTGSDTNRTADIEPDGLDNLLEYALGGNPTTDDAAAIRPISDLDATTWGYIYRRRRDAATRGLDYGLFLNTNNLVFGSWDFIGDTYETGTAIIDGNVEAVSNEIPVNANALEGFIKLEVTEN